jgi:hypothetical protein
LIWRLLLRQGLHAGAAFLKTSLTAAAPPEGGNRLLRRERRPFMLVLQLRENFGHFLHVHLVRGGRRARRFRLRRQSELFGQDFPMVLLLEAFFVGHSVFLVALLGVMVAAALL